MGFIFNKKTNTDCHEYFSLDENGFLKRKKMICAYWWDDISNFGDWIGPWLISKITNENLINVRNKKADHVLFSVGSVVEQINSNYSNVYIWGSGLIKPIENKSKTQRNLKKASISQICAVRGKLTQFELQTKLNWNVPNVYGDPALLLPRYYNPSKKSEGRVVICPHYIHYSDFMHEEIMSEFDVLDVSLNPQDIINSISSAKICLSSSLHGVIIAQAYGIPWVWLQILDKPLVGDDFKFYDFLSTMKDTKLVSHMKIFSQDISVYNLKKISNQSRLLSLGVDLNDLQSSFPKI